MIQSSNIRVMSAALLKIAKILRRDFSELENIQNSENEGLHLLYSHFRTLEGIGILRLILLANGFAEHLGAKNMNALKGGIQQLIYENYDLSKK